MNAPTLIIIVVIAILMVFAVRRAYRVFSLKDDCCGGGPKAPKAKSAIDRDAIERAVEDAGYYVSHRG